MHGKRPTVVMAGATGSVGTALRRALAARYALVILTRSKADFTTTEGAEVEWRCCDLFSLLELERALAGADYAVYLANSSLPSSRLVQGTAEDNDLIMADNFARAAQFCGLKQIVFLGGLVPAERDARGRPVGQLEVEKTLGSGSTPLTSLRAGLIAGPGNSSLRRLAGILQRWPVLVLPDWAQDPIQPIAVDDVVRAIEHCLGDPRCFGQRYDLGGPEVLTFRKLLEQTAGALGRKPALFAASRPSALLDWMWGALLGGTIRFQAGFWPGRSGRRSLAAESNPVNAHVAAAAKPFAAALRDAVDAEGNMLPNPRASLRVVDEPAIRRARRVRSIQRLPLPGGWTARQVTAEYYRWLPGALRPFLRCEIAGDGTVRVCFLQARWRLIDFTHSAQRSSEERQLLYITGGILARTEQNKKGRMEFREVLDRHCMLVAIHDFTPALPWFIYRYTQAVVHLWVAQRFGRHLGRIKARGLPPPSIPG